MWRLVSRSHPLLIKLHQTLSDIYPASRMENAPTEADAAKAELYKTSILIAHSAAGR